MKDLVPLLWACILPFILFLATEGPLSALVMTAIGFGVAALVLGAYKYYVFRKTKK